MLCKNPFMVGSVPVGCGQCLPCRINRRRLWTHRCLLESYNHPMGSLFVTMTYSPRRLPFNGSLDPKHLRHFLNLLRRAVSPVRFRFYGCGEYGDLNGAPHYHLSLFGLGIEYSALIQRIWCLGYTATYPFNETTGQYVAGYVTKKMTSRFDTRLNGRYPEFARMSNRPGIGALSLGPIVDAIHTDAGLDYLSKILDVPDHLLIGGKRVTLGRYLRQKLREEIGMPAYWVARAKQIGYSNAEAEMLALLTRHAGLSPKQAVLKENEGRSALKVSFSQLSTHKGSL